MRKCEICGRKVNTRTMKVYVVERSISAVFGGKRKYYCTDCTRCGERIVLKEMFDGVVVTPSESKAVTNDK